MQPTLSEVESLARQAGDILRAGFIQRPGFEDQHQITYKGTIDLVTEVDHQSEEFLLSEIRRRYPHHRIQSEESGVLAGQECCRWLVDPLDGTVNYAHGIPVFSVSIAYLEGDQVILGVVYDPTGDEMFTAQLGQGAWLNHLPIQVSSTPELDQSLLATGFPYDIRTNPENNLENYARFALRSHGVRRLGSAAIDLCYVAAGRFDGYWELRLQPHDMAAGTLIAREAGALVTRVDGLQDIFMPPYSILAANPSVHAQMLQVLGYKD